MPEPSSTIKSVAAGAVYQRAQTAVLYCWIAGLAALLIGAILAGTTFPSSELDPLLGSEEDSGSMFGFVLGLMLAGAGQVVLFVAVIATGVRLGTDSANR